VATTLGPKIDGKHGGEATEVEGHRFVKDKMKAKDYKITRLQDYSTTSTLFNPNQL
jgi:hypothetical protein